MFVLNEDTQLLNHLDVIGNLLFSYVKVIIFFQFQKKLYSAIELYTNRYTRIYVEWNACATVAVQNKLLFYNLKCIIVLFPS